MAYAIIKAGGKQLKVVAGEPIWVEKMKGEANDKVVFNEVLAYSDGKTLTYGKPMLNMEVHGTIQKQGREPKLIIFRTKAKSNWARKQGHRQPYTRVLVDSIVVK